MIDPRRKAGLVEPTDALPLLRDRIRPGVRVLFVGINPGVRSALTGHHFAGFSNRFWKLLYDSRLVPEPVTYLDDERLPEWGYGITNVIPRATPGIDSLTRDEYVAGSARLRRKIRRYRPQVVALVGVTVFRALFPNSRAAVALGLQKEHLSNAAVFVLPNPSGRNANYTYDEMRRAFAALARHVKRLKRTRDQGPRTKDQGPGTKYAHHHARSPAASGAERPVQLSNGIRKRRGAP